MRTSFQSLVFLIATVSLTGCGFTVGKPVLVSSPSAEIKGRIIGGQNPVVGSKVSVWQFGVADYGSGAVQLSPTVTSAADGSFSFPANSYPCDPVPTADSGSLPSYVYILASGGDSGGGNNSSIMLAAGLGSCPNAQSTVVDINEVTTVATAYALAQFFTVDAKKHDDFGAPGDANNIEYIYLMHADGFTIPTLVDLPSGTVNPNTTLPTSPIAVTIEAPKIYSLANTLAACVNTADTVVDTVVSPSTECASLFSLTTEASITPADTLQAAVSMARFPYVNVLSLYQLATKSKPFSGLKTPPNDLTIAVSYATNIMGLGINPAPDGAPTSSNIDIDTYGDVWFPTDAPSAGGLAFFDPTATAFTGPFDYLGILPLSPQYIALDATNQLAWITDQQSRIVLGFSTSGNPGEYERGYEVQDTGNSTIFAGAGPIVISDNGLQFFAFTDSSDSTTVQVGYLDTAVGSLSNLTHSSTGLSLNTTLSNDPNDPFYPVLIAATNTSSFSPCYEELTYNKKNTVSDVSDVDTIEAETETACATGGVATGQLYTASSATQQDEVSVASTAGALCSVQLASCFSPAVALNLPEGIAVDGFGQLWIANSGDGSISTLSGVYQSPTAFYTETSPVPYKHDALNGGTMTTPYGLAIDGAGNVWVSNANPGCETTATPGSCTYLLSELIGAAAPTIMPLSLQDDQLQGTVPNPLGTSAFVHVGPKSSAAPKRAAQTAARHAVR